MDVREVMGIMIVAILCLGTVLILIGVISLAIDLVERIRRFGEVDHGIFITDGEGRFSSIANKHLAPHTCYRVLNLRK